MKLGRLVIRSLALYWRTGFVVAFGVAVATAVIVGSLVVGGSVTGSIRDTALSRLGEIDHAIIAPRFFRARLAARLAADPAASERVRLAAPAIIVEGSARAPKTGAAVPNVQVAAVGDDFWKLYGARARPELSGRAAAVNEALARDLGVGAGDAVIVNIPRIGYAPADSLFARRARSSTLGQLRLKIVSVLAAGDGGNFALDAGTGTPRNIFVSREWLCGRLELGDVANTVLVSSKRGRAPALPALSDALERAAGLPDYGLRPAVNERQGYVLLRSNSLLLTPAEVNAAREAAGASNAAAALTSVYLATTIRQAGGEESIAYAVVAGMDALEPMTLRAGRADKLAASDIVLNTWAADDLGAKVGDRVDVSYLVAARDGSHLTRTRSFTVSGIVELAGPAADPELVPEFEGITDVEKISDWRPPFPIDRGRITARDDEYWEKRGATPKAFVSTDAVRAMWGGEGLRGWVTSVRFRPAAGQDLGALEQALASTLPVRMARGPGGLRFRPVRELALASAKGSTDFGQLFLAMSMFLVIAAMALAGTLLRLSVERRASEMGMLLATGFRPARARRVAVCEGLVLAALGSVVGAPLGLAYARGIVHALSTWWRDAVGNAAIWLHVEPASVAIGWAAGIGAGVVSVLWGVRALERRKVLDLLSGGRVIGAAASAAGVVLAKRLLALCVVAAAALGVAVGLEWISATGAFFGIGAALLAAGLLLCYVALTAAGGGRRRLSLWRIAARSAMTHRRRSMLAIGQIACACFIIVAVAANERDFARTDVGDVRSGAGGFSLKAESSLPIHYDFGTQSGRKKLHFDPKDEAVFEGVRVFSFLLASGEDASCLNLAKPVQPRIVGVPEAFIERGGFSLRTEDDDAAGWSVLHHDLGHDRVSAVGDAESVRWQLFSGQGSGLGRLFPIATETGDERSLVFRGLVPFSIFGPELLVSESNFRKLFPAEQSPRYFLIETPPGKEAAVAESLRRNLGDLGLEVRSTREILDDLIGVQNTYLSTFLALGGLGVLLGTVGLVVVLLRNALERRGEFALMLATGFSRRYLAALLIVENSGLLAAGLACGTVSALVAVGPQLSSATASVNWAALAGLLLGIMVVGLASCAAAAAASVRSGLIEALRAE